MDVFSGGAPNTMIIGPDSAGGFNGTLGSYTSANPSITGNHQPSVLGSATFTITIPGVTAGSVLSGVKFEFGTGPDSTTSGMVPKVPNFSVPDNGATLALLGMALTSIGLFQRRFGRSVVSVG